MAIEPRSFPTVLGAEINMEAQLVDEKGNKVGTLNLARRGPEKPFDSGNLGYNGFGRIDINGKAHQVSFNLIEIDSATAETIATAKKLREEKAKKKAAKK